MASYIAIGNAQAALWVTLLLMGTFALCLALTFFSLKVSQSLSAYLEVSSTASESNQVSPSINDEA